MVRVRLDIEPIQTGFLPPGLLRSRVSSSWPSPFLAPGPSRSAPESHPSPSTLRGPLNLRTEEAGYARHFHRGRVSGSRNLLPENSQNSFWTYCLVGIVLWPLDLSPGAFESRP